MGVYFTTFGGFIALTAWLPVYWVSLHSVSLVTAGILAGVYSIITSLVRVGGGYLSDRLGGETTGILSLATMLAGAILMSLSGTFGLSVVAEVILAVGMGVTNAAVFKLVAQEVPEAVGGAAGWVGGLGAFGGFAIPPIMGTFVQIQGNRGYATGFVIFVCLAAFSLLLVRMLRRERAIVHASG